MLARAAQGDGEAWVALVERFNDMVWSVARGFRLDEATAKDVAQTVWLRLVENMDRIKDPERLPGWLATTARNEALRMAKRADRTRPTEFEFDLADESPSVDDLMIDEEESRLLAKAFRLLDEACQTLLRLMTIEPPLTYDEISDLTGRPVGSLGPTRARCLDKLRGELSRITGAV